VFASFREVRSLRRDPVLAIEVSSGRELRRSSQRRKTGFMGKPLYPYANRVLTAINGASSAELFDQLVLAAKDLGWELEKRTTSCYQKRADGLELAIGISTRTSPEEVRCNL